EALSYYEHVLDIYLQQQKTPLHWLVSVSGDIAKIYLNYNHNYDAALRYQLMSHEYELKSNVIHRTDNTDDICGKKNSTAMSLKKLSDIYIKLGQYDSAYKNMMAAVKLFEEVLQSPDVRDTLQETIDTKLTLANICVKLCQYDLACEHLKSATQICQGRPRFNEEKCKIADISMKVSQGYAELQQSDQAYQCLVSALSVYRDINTAQYESRKRITRAVNGRIQRHQLKCTIVYVTE
ncbi:unnamed protein product, partial [Rotaria sp. Silwood2]